LINESLQFLAKQSTTYLNDKFPGSDPNQPLVIVGNISPASDTATQNSAAEKPAVLSLVNIEEDRMVNLRNNYPNTNTRVVLKNPPICLNLFILFSINRKNYDESLRFLSNIIQFFHEEYIFTSTTHPDLLPTIDRLTVDLHNLSFEQSNHLWSTLGEKYLPSVMYKVRLVQGTKMPQ
jgi:hypothetical protein